MDYRHGLFEFELLNARLRCAGADEWNELQISSPGGEFEGDHLVDRFVGSEAARKFELNSTESAAAVTG